jgi:hypothetical protein
MIPPLIFGAYGTVSPSQYHFHERNHRVGSITYIPKKKKKKTNTQSYTSFVLFFFSVWVDP